ncbi:MAG: hypothetical protein GY716_00600 [bacterium]|nr:hypothetical protein [bacterium]
MRTQRNLLLLLALGSLMVAGCLSSDNPVDTPPGTEVDPAPYLGTWNMTELDGASPPPSEMQIAATDTGTEIELQYSYSDEGHTETASLTLVGSAVVASIRSEEGLWTIVRLRLENNGTELVIDYMDQTLVQQAIEGATLAGEILGDLTDDQPAIVITDTGPAIRTFIEGTPDLFMNRAAAFTKGP